MSRLNRPRQGMGSINDLLANWQVPSATDKGTESGRTGKQASKQAGKQAGKLQGRHLMEYCRVMDRLEKLLVQVMPTDMRQEVKLAKYEEGQAVVFCRRADHASYLKYHSQEMIEILSNVPEFNDLVKIKVYRQEI